MLLEIHLFYIAFYGNSPWKHFQDGDATLNKEHSFTSSTFFEEGKWFQQKLPDYVEKIAGVISLILANSAQISIPNASKIVVTLYKHLAFYNLLMGT